MPNGISGTSEQQLVSQSPGNPSILQTKTTTETDPIWTAAISNNQTIFGNWTFGNTIMGNISGNAATATTARNLVGRATGSLPYQTAENTTGFFAIGPANTILTSTGIAPQWVTSLTDAHVADNLTINGGTLDNTVIDGTTPVEGTFTNLTATGNTTFGDGSGADEVTFGSTTTINGNLIPTTNNAHNLGSIGNRWKEDYFNDLVVSTGVHFNCVGNIVHPPLCVPAS